MLASVYDLSTLKGVHSSKVRMMSAPSSVRAGAIMPTRCAGRGVILFLVLCVAILLCFFKIRVLFNPFGSHSEPAGTQARTLLRLDGELGRQRLYAPVDIGPNARMYACVHVCVLG